MGLKAFDSAMRTASNVTFNSTTWANVDTGLDLTLPAEVGDIVEVGISGTMENSAVTSYMNVGSFVSAALVNMWGDGGAEAAGDFGVNSWRGDTGVSHPVTGSVTKEIVSGDLDSGVLTLRFRYKTSTATNKQLFANSTLPFHVWAKNHGAA